MNRLEGSIEKIRVCESLSLVTIDCLGQRLSSIIIETPKTVDYLIEKNSIQVLFKETEVIIGLGSNQSVSLQNQLPCKITSIKKGELLSAINLDFKGMTIRSIITSNAVNQLELKAGMEVLALIKTNEVMLAKV